MGQTAASSLGTTVGHAIMPALVLTFFWKQRLNFMILAFVMITLPFLSRILPCLFRCWFRSLKGGSYQQPQERPSKIWPYTQPHCETGRDHVAPLRDQQNSPIHAKNLRRQSSPASYSYSPGPDEDIAWLRTLTADADESGVEMPTAADLA